MAIHGEDGPPVRRIPFPRPWEDLRAGLQHPDNNPPDCLGHFAASAPECTACTAPVVHQDRVCLVRDMCRALRRGRAPTAVLAANLGSKEVRNRLVAGASADEILAELTGPDPSPEVRATAREVLGRRFAYLASKGYPVPPLP